MIVAAFPVPTGTPPPILPTSEPRSFQEFDEEYNGEELEEDEAEELPGGVGV